MVLLGRLLESWNYPYPNYGFVNHMLRCQANLRLKARTLLQAIEVLVHE
jgi:hypothetical protein